MRIMLLKAVLIGKQSHAQGDVVECDDQRAKYLIRNAHALEIKVTRTAPPTPVEDEKREAVLKPKNSRKAVLDV
jgi:hypothetical protein